MSLGGFYTAVKYLMFAFNFIFWLLGCAVLGVGIWVRSEPELAKYVNGTGAVDTVYVGSYILMGVGSLIMVIGFLGCCGAMRESQCLLGMFFTFLFVIFVTLLGMGLYVTFTQHKLRPLVEKHLKNEVDIMENYTEENQQERRASAEKFMAGLQEKLSCCGATDKASGDYKVVPASCPGKKETNGSHMAPPEEKSCTDKLFYYLNNYIVIIAGVAIGIGIVMIFGMVFSCLLCFGIRVAERNTDYRYKY